jgi:hypothetical protein
MHGGSAYLGRRGSLITDLTAFLTSGELAEAKRISHEGTFKTQRKGKRKSHELTYIRSRVIVWGKRYHNFAVRRKEFSIVMTITIVQRHNLNPRAALADLSSMNIRRCWQLVKFAK